MYVRKYFIIGPTVVLRQTLTDHFYQDPQRDRHDHRPSLWHARGLSCDPLLIVPGEDLYGVGGTLVHDADKIVLTGASHRPIEEKDMISLAEDLDHHLQLLIVQFNALEYPQGMGTITRFQGHSGDVIFREEASVGDLARDYFLTLRDTLQEQATMKFKKRRGKNG